jgi:hypothetical protein
MQSVHSKEKIRDKWRKMKFKSKKAQNVGQIFIYVLSVFIVGIILLFGYNSIAKIADKGSLICAADLKNAMKSSINSITPDYGTFKKQEFRLCSSEYSNVCFVRNYNTGSVNSEYTISPANTGRNAALFRNYPIIFDNIDSTFPAEPNPLKNVFLIKNKKEAEPFEDIGEIRFADDNTVIKCFNVVNSRLIINVEGKGNHVVIS